MILYHIVHDYERKCKRELRKLRLNTFGGDEKRFINLLGTVQGRLEGIQGDVSRWYDFPVFLAKTNRAPLILGFADLLENLKLTVDYPMDEAWVEKRDP